MQVPVADLGKSPNGSVLAAPMVYIPANAIANTTTEYGLRFRILKENSTSYINELSRLYYYVSQIALGNKRCSPGYRTSAHRCIGHIAWLKLHPFACCVAQNIRRDWPPHADEACKARLSRGFGGSSPALLRC